METTLYKKEPVSVKPEISGWYNYSVKNSDVYSSFWYSKEEDKIFRFNAYSEVNVIPDFWLKPVSASEAPDENKILEIIQANYNKFSGTNEAELHSSEEIAALFLPHFALLKEENETMKKKESWLMEELKKENDRLKSRVSELEGMAKKYIELFESSDMRPEDECHELYNQMKNIYTHSHPNV